MSITGFEPEPDFGVTAEPGPTGLQFAPDGIVNAEPTPRFSTSSDLEGLLHLGYLTDDFELYGHRFAIRTLRRGEKLAVAQIVSEFSDSIALGDAIATATVAACLLLVDGRPLSPPLGIEEDNNPATWIRRNFGIVNKWYDPPIEGVYQKYNALLARQTKAFLELEGK